MQKQQKANASLQDLNAGVKLLQELKNHPRLFTHMYEFFSDAFQILTSHDLMDDKEFRSDFACRLLEMKGLSEIEKSLKTKEYEQELIEVIAFYLVEREEAQDA
jgi:hypothetical protein